MLEIAGVSKTFADGAGVNHTALEQVELSIGEHEILATLRSLLQRYAAERTASERFGDFLFFVRCYFRFVHICQ